MADQDGTFIDVEVSGAAATDPEIAKKLEEVCPVDIFKAGGSGTEVVRRNLDECVLCELCLEAAPAGTVVVRTGNRRVRSSTTAPNCAARRRRSSPARVRSNSRNLGYGALDAREGSTCSAQ